MKKLFGLMTIFILSSSVSIAQTEAISEKEMEKAKIADANAKMNNRDGIRRLSEQVTDGTKGRRGSVQEQFASKSKVQSITEPANSSKASDQTKPTRPTDQ